jgi:hypothetical protein
MTLERDHDRTHAPETAAPADHDLAPGRSNRSNQLASPDRPLVSALILRKARDTNGVADSADQSVATASTSTGHSLPGTLMRKFESSLGADLSSVRVHTGSESQAAAHAVGAKAYTLGNDIHFGSGHYDPTSHAGEHLLAHEVAHTVQQTGSVGRKPMFKLEVSQPGDAHETEADQAADAMVAGVSTTVGSATGLMRDPLPGTIGPFSPNASKHGVVYSVPTNDYKSQAPQSAPPMTSEMPSANIADPGIIPGWTADIPAREGHLGPFAYTEPAQRVVIQGAEHSQEMQDAWEQYKDSLIPAVKSTWDGGAKAKMNTYAQQAHSDPELDKLVADMHDTYRMSNVGQKGQGTVSDQAGKTNIYNNQNAPDIAAQVAAKGDMKGDLQATAQAGTNGTVGGPVGKVVDDLKAERLLTIGSLGRLQGFQGEIEASQHDLAAATASIEIEDLNTKIEDEKKKKEEIENGQRTLKKIDPELARMVAMVQANSDKLKTLGGMLKAAPEAMEGDPGAILEIGKSVLEVAKWSELAQIDSNISAIADQVKTKFKLKNDEKLMAAKGHVAASAKLAQSEAQALLGHLLKEKQLHLKLADAVEANWKGKDQKDGKLAAQALRALPAVRKVIRTLTEIKGSLPQLPDASTRASQGFTLATQGVNAPGAVDLLTTAGWIKGAPAAIDPELKKWTDINAQLESVTGGLGL